MPQAIGLLVVQLTAPIVGLSSAFTLGGLASSLVGLTGRLLLSAAISSLTRPDLPDPVRPDNIQLNSKNAAAARTRHYGLVKVGGNVVFHRAREGFSFRVIGHGHGEISNIVQRFLNNEPVEIDGSGFVTDSQYQRGGRSRVRLLERFGVVPETHYAEISAVWEEWTPAHRLDGLVESDHL